MSNYEASRAWLRHQRTKGYTHGLLVARRSVKEEAKLVTRGAISKAMWEDGWTLFLCEFPEDREALKARLPKADHRPDPFAQSALVGSADGGE